MNDPERDLILERIPLIIGYGLYLGLQRFSKNLPKHLTKAVTKKDVLAYFQQIFADMYAIKTVSEVFIEESLAKHFINVSLNPEELSKPVDETEPPQITLKYKDSNLILS